jgi:hypothetical protein
MEEHDVASMLQAKLQAKNEDALRLRLEIRKAELEASVLRLQLQVHGAGDESVIPASMGTGGRLRAADLKFSEHKRLVEWLAENCETSSKQAFNVPDPEVNVGGHRALLGQMVQWPLNVPGGLRLSAPIEAEADLMNILAKSRKGVLAAEEIEDFADQWLLVTTDLVADSVATAALFLIHKESEKAIVVSSWPNIFVEQPVVAASFDATAFFSRTAPQSPVPLPSTVLAPSADDMTHALMATEVAFTDAETVVNRLHCRDDGGLLWVREYSEDGASSRLVEELGVNFSCDEQFTLTGPFGSCVIANPLPGPLQRNLVRGLVSLALEHGVRVQRSSTPTVTAPACTQAEVSDSDESETSMPMAGRPRRRRMSSGDHVEVKYNGSRLRGVLQDVCGEVAHVKCDVDDNGVITVAPVDRVRLADFNIEGQAESEHLAKGFGQC